MDLTRSDKMIVDVVQIYNVANVSGREPESCISICSSADGMKCALLINDYPQRGVHRKARLLSGQPSEPAERSVGLLRQLRSSLVGRCDCVVEVGSSPNRSVSVEGDCAEVLNRSAYRSGLQTTSSGCRQKPWS